MVWRYICFGCGCEVFSFKTSIKVVEFVEEGDIRGCGGGFDGFVVCNGLEFLLYASGVGVGEVFFYFFFVVVFGFFDVFF